MLEQLVPPPAATVEAFDDPQALFLYPEEEAIVARAVESRRREFTTGRSCARAALARLGLLPAAITKGEQGAPCWPDGVVGSITHCKGYRAAAVGRATDFRTIGIDAEPNAPTPMGVLELIALPQERARVDALAGSASSVSWDRVLFSAKESVYKAWFPLTGMWLEFEDVEVTFDPASGAFTASVSLAPSMSSPELADFSVSGRFAVGNGLILTAVAEVPPTR